MKISWYINRLSKMTLPEIPHRVSERLKKEIDKHRTFHAPENFSRPDKSVFLLTRYATADCLHKYYHKTMEQHLSIADLAVKNCFSAFEVDIQLDNVHDWHSDPVTKKKWPQKFWGDINYRDKSLGGVKFVWEINRLYGVFSLAIAYRYTQKTVYADKILSLIQSWLDNNPYPKGVNWSCGIEAGIRLANLTWALSFLEHYQFTKENLKTINAFVWFHANHLLRYPSKFSSSNNHLLAEVFGLFVAGRYFPHFKEAETWLDTGKKYLENEVSRQILPDGGSFEYSTTYLSFVVDFFLLYKISCQADRITCSPEIDSRLEKACEFISSIMDKNGNIPNIGDQDSAVVVNFGISNLENFSSILNTGAFLFDRKDFVTGRPDIKTWILTGSTQDDCKPTDQNFSYFFHKHSGLSVIKDYASKKELVFTGNAMPLGMAPLCAHGHLDALSFTLSVDGLEVFVDPGTYLYYSGGHWRQYFRSTAAHNTIRVNNQDLSEQAGDFMFGRPYSITEHRLEPQNNKIIWSARHDAYFKKKPFADVLRTIEWDRTQKEFIITDSINHNFRLFIELFFHCHPECVVEKKEHKILIKRRHIALQLCLDTSLQSDITCGSKNPDSGWYSPDFNKLMKTHTIRSFGEIDHDRTVKTYVVLSLKKRNII